MLQASLAAETKTEHDIAIHIASPGMVATELLLGGDKDPRAAKCASLFNYLP